MMYERKPTLHREGATPRDTCIARPVEPLLHVCHQKEGGHDEVVKKGSGDALVVVLRACYLLVDERIVDFEPGRSAEGGGIKDSNRALNGASNTLHDRKGGNRKSETLDDAQAKHVHKSSCQG